MVRLLALAAAVLLFGVGIAAPAEADVLVGVETCDFYGTCTCLELARLDAPDPVHWHQCVRVY